MSEELLRRATELHIAMCEQSAAQWRDYTDRFQATPAWQEQEARRRAIEELRMNGEDEAADMVAMAGRRPPASSALVATARIGDF